MNCCRFFNKLKKTRLWKTQKKLFEQHIISKQSLGLWLRHHVDYAIPPDRIAHTVFFMRDNIILYQKQNVLYKDFFKGFHFVLICERLCEFCARVVGQNPPK